MRIQSSLAPILIVLALAAGCSSRPVLPDSRPLGDVTAAPRECDLISTNAIKLATGLDNYKARGTKMDMGRRFQSCTVMEDMNPGGDLGLLIELFDPSTDHPEDLENTKVINGGSDLPAMLAPGFTARRKNAKGQVIASVYGWTSDYKRLLIINIIEGAPGRDSLADAVEFFRQLKPLLLDKPR